MPSGKAALLLHGITMSGTSMLRTLGPLRDRLEERGVTLVAPNGGHRMSSEEVASLGAWTKNLFEKAGQNAADWFRDGKFWQGNEHYDWFRSNTDAGGKKTYGAVEQSLDVVADAIRGRDVSGVIGFSQGAAMAIVVAVRALKGDARFAGLRWGVFLSGFRPVFDEPKLVTYPAVGDFHGLFVIGDQDPLFPGGHAHIASMAQAFAAPTQELVVVPGLNHDVPESAAEVERIAAFAAAH